MAMHPETQRLVLKTLAANVAEIMPDVDAAAVSIEGLLADYGCNSIDRADIVWKTLEDLRLDIPVTEFSGVSDIRGLTELLCRYLERR
jgi:acyl carrier protein